MNKPDQIQAVLVTGVVFGGFLLVSFTNILNNFTWRKFAAVMMIVSAALTAIMVIFTAVK